MPEYRQNTSYDDFKYDPEADKSAKYRLPFALCKANGIAIQDWWTPRDAWEALKNGNFVNDVSEEYAEYYRKLKRESNKIYAKRAQQKKRQLKDIEHNPDYDYKHVDGAIAGVSKGEPMTFEQADSGNVNPFFTQTWNKYTQTGYIGYVTNCQTCVATYIARRQGYDVRALPNLNNKSIYLLSHNPALAYKDKDGKNPKQTPKPASKKMTDFLEETVKAGEIYSVEFGWKRCRAGHIVIAERSNDGNIMLYDPQSNEIIPKSKMRYYFSQTKHQSVMNLTNCRLDEEFCDKIMKISKK